MGATIRTIFSDALPNNEIGVVTGSVVPTQFLASAPGMVRLKSALGNSGVFFLGGQPSGCTFPLDSGEDTGWVSIDTMDDLYYRNPSGTGDYMHYWLQY